MPAAFTQQAFISITVKKLQSVISRILFPDKSGCYHLSAPSITDRMNLPTLEPVPIK